MQAASPTPELVKNIRAEMTEVSFNVPQAVSAGNRVFMVANDPVHGEELWVSDGTSAGTRMVRDIHPGAASALISEVVVSGGKVFFNADDGVHGQELWITDGTAAGTRMVTEIATTSGAGANPTNLKAFKGGVIFAADSGWSPTALWMSDGTPAGTVRLKTLSDGYSEALNFASSGWLAGGSYFYFHHYNEGSGTELWRTDGTAAGTLMLKDINVGDAGSDPAIMGSLGNTLFFSAYQEETGYELWKTNGTPAGTVMVKEMVEGEDGADFVQAVETGGKLYYLAYLSRQSPSLLVTNGTAAGTRAITIPEALTQGGIPQQIVAMGSQILVTYFQNYGQYQFSKVIAYDTRQARSRLLFDTWAYGLQGSSELVSAGNKVYIRAGINGRSSLWVTDGTEAGTERVSPAYLEESGLNVYGPFAMAGSKLLFHVSDGGISNLWRSDGTAEGTVQVTEPAFADASAVPAGLARVGNRLFFSADDGVHGRELWMTDGSGSGTVLVKDIRAGSNASSPARIAEMGGIAYFVADDGSTGPELWRSDGTEAGTWRVKDINPGLPGAGIDELSLFGGRLYFRALSPSTGSELWATDGTEAGTVLVANLHADNSVVRHSYPGQFTAAGGYLYFTATASSGFSLMCTNGSPGNMVNLGSFGTIDHIVARPPSPGASLAPDQPVLFFVGNGSGQKRLYHCVNGTSPVQAVSFPGNVPIHIMGLLGHQLFLSSSYYLEGSIWRTDGTQAGTVQMVDDLLIPRVKIAGNKVFYWTDKANGYSTEMWCMNADGSDRVKVKDDLAYLNEQNAQAAGNTFFFTVTTSGETVPWQSQGTPESTRPVSGLTLQEMYSWPGEWNVQTLGNKVYLPAFRPDVGNELFSLEQGAGLEVREVLTAGGTRVLTDGTVLDLGAQKVAEPVSVTLRLINAGSQSLTGVTFSLTEGTPFQISPASPGTLDPGEVAEVQVTYVPSQAGPQQASVQITGTAGEDLFTHELTLKGQGVAQGSVPVIRRITGPRLVLAGQPVSFDASWVTDEPISSYVWQRAGTTVGSQAVLSLSSPQLTDAGLYTLRVTTSNGTATSPPSVLAVVNPAQPSVTVLQGRVLALECAAKAPAGSTLAYQWLLNGIPMSSIDRVSGAQSSKLTVINMQDLDVGSYECRVTLTAEGAPTTLSQGFTAVRIMKRPVVTLPEEGFIHYIGQRVSYQVETDVSVTRVTAKGLPPGLTMTVSGLITGRPTRSLATDETGLPLPYQVTFTFTNAAGVSDPVTIPWRIRALLPVGSYVGLIDHAPALDDLKHIGLGSSIKVTVSSAGSVSGQLQHEGKTYRFANPPLLEADPESSSAMTRILLPRGSGRTPLYLQMGLYGAYAELFLSDSESPPDPAQGILRRVAYSSREPASAFDGYYTVALDPDLGSGGPLIPRGNGFLTATISKAGAVTWKGKLADGTPITGSSGLVTDGFGAPVNFPVHHELYKAGGSLHGWADMDANGATGPALMNGLLQWVKGALPETSKERNHKAGFPHHGVSLAGNEYAKPAKGEVIFGLEDYDGNIGLNLSNGGMGDYGLTQSVTFTAAHRVILPAYSLETPLKSLSISVSLGTFKGSFVMKDSDPTAPARLLTRTVNFEGVLLPAYGSARGFFLMPELPQEGPPKTTLSTSPLRSGGVQFYGQ